MWNHDSPPPLAPRLTDDTFQPWHSRASPHDFSTSSAPGEDFATAFGTAFGTAMGTLVCLVVLAVELLVVVTLWRVRVAFRMGRFWWKRFVVVLLFSGVLVGCHDVSRGVLLVTGCDPTAIDAGYCHMPKARP